MMKFKRIMLLMTMPILLNADLNDNLNKFFDQVGSVSTVNSSDVYQGQKAGFYTGGSAAVRNKVVDTNLAGIHLPKIDAGCGGIDIFAGGVSFVKHDQLIKTMKGIASNAIGYSFLLGMETISPQVANTMKQLQSWANTINSLGINSCETAAQLTGSVWPKNALASQHICRSLGGQNAFLSDYVSARHQCSQPNSYNQLMSGLENNKAYEDLLLEEHNIAWKAIRKQKLLSENVQLAEFFMTLTGTLIIRKDSTSIDTWPSRIQDESFLQTLLHGGKTSVYECIERDSNTQCLNITTKDVTITPSQALIGKVLKDLNDIQNKIWLDEELTEAQRALLTQTKFPLYKIVNVLTAYKKGECPVDLYQIADLVALDILIQSLREVLETARMAAEHLKRHQMYDLTIGNYIGELQKVEETVRYYETKDHYRREREFQMILKLQQIEEKIASEVII